MHVGQLRRGDRGKPLENIQNNESRIEKIVLWELLLLGMLYRPKPLHGRRLLRFRVLLRS
jgi:hypothetical protein